VTQITASAVTQLETRALFRVLSAALGRAQPEGKTAFVLSGKAYKNQRLRVVLLPTGMHAGATSVPVLVPPPS
jgi:hypothetical protein